MREQHRRRCPAPQRARRRFKLLPLAALFVVLGMVPAALVTADTSPQQPAADRVTPYPTGETQGAEPVRPEPGTAGEYRFPEPGITDVALDAEKADVAGSPLAISLSQGEGGAVSVEVLAHEKVAERGGQLLGFRFSAKDDGAARSRAKVTIDFSAIEAAFGEDYASRLQLYYIPDCYASGIENKFEACQPRLLESVNDYATKTLTADVDVTPAASEPADESTQSQIGGGGFFLGSGSGGTFGDYGASGLGGAASWSVGLQSGNFGWSKDLALPPTVAGPQPQVSVTYSSQSVDGMTGQSNSQPSRVGLGFDLSTEAFISVTPYCGLSGCGDLNPQLSLLGQGGKLLMDFNNPTKYRLEIDPGWIAEQVSGYWKVTTPDGTQYFFGSRSAATGSVWGRWLCDASACNARPYRYNLDKILDPSGNIVELDWTRETNRYNAGVWGELTYDRGGYLTAIRYGKSTTSGGSFPTTVTFTYDLRCVQLSSCAQPLQGQPDTNYPDVPTDRYCPPGGPACPAGNTTQTFFSIYRLIKVSTSVREYHFTHTFLNSKLFLQFLQERGVDAGWPGGGLWMPAIRFDGTAFNNRVPLVGGDPTWPLHRVTQIRDELGKKTVIAYGQPHPCPTPPTNTVGNSTDCQPFVSGIGGPVTSVYNKYLTLSVTESDSTTAGSPSILTAYTYVDTPVWRWNSSANTWNEWRGHSEVLVEKGASGTKTRTKYLIFRGMYGNATVNNGSGSQSVSLGWLSGTSGSCSSEAATAQDRDWLRGQVRQVVRLDGSTTVLAAERHFYSDTVAPGFYTGTSPRLVREKKSEQTLGASPCTVTRTDYDTTHGLPTKVRIDGEWASSSDDRCLLISQLKNTTLGIVDKRSREQYFANSNCSSSKYADVEYAYDGLAIGSNAFTRGLLTLVRRYSSASASIDTTFAYDAAYGRPTGVTDPNSHTTTSAYSPSTGNPSQVSMTNAAGHVVTTAFNAGLGVPTSFTDQRGKVTTISYDPVGRRLKVWLPTEPTSGPETFSFAYYLDNTQWPSGTLTKAPPRIQSFWLQDGSYPQTWDMHDGFGRLVQSQAYSPGPSGGRVVSSLKYDQRGLVAEVFSTQWATDPGGGAWPLVTPSANSTRYTYDPLERVTRGAWWSGGTERWASVTTFSNRTVTVNSTDPSFEETATTFDAAGRVISLREYTGASTYAQTTYSYTPRNDLATITDAAGNVVSFTYDWLSRRTAQSHPDSGAWTFAYDGAGNLQTSTDALGKQLWYAYDTIDRLLTIRENSVSGALLASNTYDATSYAGLPDASTRHYPSGDYTVRNSAYDDRGRLTQKQFIIPAAEGALSGTYAFDYTYTTADQLKTVTYPSGGSIAAETVTTSYSALGVPTSTASAGDTYVSSTTYDNLGRLVGRSQGSGAGLFERSFSFDSITERLSNTESRVAGIAQQDDSYSYDLAGNITRITDDITGQRRCFSHDVRQRLTHAWTTDVNCTDGASPNSSFGPDPFDLRYSYNDIGNLTAVQDGSNITNYSYNASGPSSTRPHAVTSAGTDSYAYNANGDMTGRTVASVSSTLTWDAMQRLSSVQTGAQTSTYLYDASGNRLLRKDPGKTVLYLDGQELELQGANLTTTRYYGHGGATVAMRKVTSLANEVYWLGSDHQASASLAVRASDGAVSLQRYLPFGGSRGTPNQLPHDRGFVGQTEDDATALVYLNARYYDARLARFISADPIARPSNPQTFNAYSYALNSPVTYADASGLDVYWSEANNRWEDSTNGAYWDSNDGWIDPQNGARWSSGGGWQDSSGNTYRDDKWIDTSGNELRGDTWVDPKNGAEWRNGEWINPKTGAFWHTSDQVWVEPHTGRINSHTDTGLSVVTAAMMPDPNLHGGGGWSGGGRTGPGYRQVMPPTQYKAFTDGNRRHNLMVKTNWVAPRRFDAHHMLPRKFTEAFAQRGINIHDPKYLIWLERSQHQHISRSYNSEWQRFFQSNPTATIDDIHSFALQLSRDPKFGMRHWTGP